MHTVMLALARQERAQCLRRTPGAQAQAGQLLVTLPEDLGLLLVLDAQLLIVDGAHHGSPQRVLLQLHLQLPPLVLRIPASCAT